MLSETRLMITADDFGYSEPTNHAIVSSVNLSGVSEVSMMMNQSGCSHAMELLGSNKLAAARVGVHVNLTEGFPLTEKIRSISLFCGVGGSFIYGRDKPIFRLTKKEKRAVTEEVEAQILKFINTGIAPAHLDSHHHVHTEWGLLRIFVRLARKYRIPRIRIARNTGSAQNRLKNTYRNMVNGYLRKVSGMDTTDFFGSIDDIRQLVPVEALAGKTIEVMVHPMINAAGLVVDSDQQDLSVKINEMSKLYPFTM